MIDYGFGVSLDIVSEENLEKIRSWRNNPKVWRWCRQNDLIYPENQTRWYEWQRDDLNTRMYLIESGGQVVGICGLTNIDFVSRRAEFSLYIAPEFQGKKFSKNSLKTLFSYGFNELGLKSIWGETFDDNKARHIFKALGMKEDGIRREFYFKDGRFCDAILFSMIDTEFFELEGEWLHSTPAS